MSILFDIDHPIGLLLQHIPQIYLKMLLLAIEFEAFMLYKREATSGFRRLSCLVTTSSLAYATCRSRG